MCHQITVVSSRLVLLCKDLAKGIYYKSRAHTCISPPADNLIGKVISLLAVKVTQNVATFVPRISTSSRYSSRGLCIWYSFILTITLHAACIQ